MESHTTNRRLSLVLSVAILLMVLANMFVSYGQRRKIDQAISVADKAAGLAEQVASSQKSEPTNAVDQATIETAIRNVLSTQQQAWNAGDIPQFMESYWKSDDLTFSSGGNITKGWQATLDRYQKKYSSRSEMGTLSFSGLEITPLRPDAAMVLGEWQLTRKTDTLGGKFTLVMRCIKGKWLIIHDHTS